MTPLLPPHPPLSLRARRSGAGMKVGAHVARSRGRGLDFAEVRPYAPGDDPRLLDGNVSARTGIPHIKLFTEERDRTVHFVVDFGPDTLASPRADAAASGGLAWAVAQTAAVLGKAAFADGDRIRLHLARRSIPKHTGDLRVRSLARFVDALTLALHQEDAFPSARATSPWGRFRQAISTFLAFESTATEPACAFTEHLVRLQKTVRRHELVVAISPFPGEQWVAPMAALALRAELVVVPVFLPPEAMVPRDDVHILRDARRGTPVFVDGGDARLREEIIQREGRRQEFVLGTFAKKQTTHVHSAFTSVVVEANGLVLPQLARHFGSRRGKR